MNSYERIYEALINEIGDSPEGQERIADLLDKRKRQEDKLRKEKGHRTGTQDAIRALYHSQNQRAKVAAKLLGGRKGFKAEKKAQATHRANIEREARKPLGPGDTHGHQTNIVDKDTGKLKLDRTAPVSQQLKRAITQARAISGKRFKR